MEGTDQIRDEQARLWNGRAGQAWVDERELLDQLFEPFAERLAEAVSPGSEAQVLDVGCGTGGTTLAVARRLAEAGHCVGIDISEPMIAAARARAEQTHARASFLRADAQRYPFEPTRFDTIISRFGVMFFDDPVRAFTNLRGAAQRGAALHFFAWRSAAENPFMTTAERAAAPFMPGIPQRRSDAPGQFAFADQSRIHGILAASGWAAIDIQPWDVTCSMPEAALVPYLTQLGPLGLLFPQIDAARRAELIATVRAAFDPYVHGPEVRFTAACWLARATA